MITDLRKPINRIAGPINRWGVGASAHYHPATALENAIIYDQQDLTSMYAGRTGGANSTVAGFVGLQLDVGQMGGLSAETFIAAQDELFLGFSGGIGAWQDNLDGSWSIDGSQVASEDLVADGTITGAIGSTVLWEFTVVGDSVLLYANHSTPETYTAGTHRVIQLANSSLARFRAFAGVVSTVSNISVKIITGYHRAAPADDQRPTLAESGGVYSIIDDNVNDVLNTTMPDLGTDATEVIVTTSGVTINDGLTIGAGVRDTLVDDMVAYVAVGYALTSQEATDITAWGNALRGA